MDARQLEALMARLPQGTVTSHPGEVAAHAHDRWALALLRGCLANKGLAPEPDPAHAPPIGDG